MIKIVREQVVYNAGSHLDVKCIYRNSTDDRGGSAGGSGIRGGSGWDGQGGSPSQREVLRLLQASRDPSYFLGEEEAVSEDTIVWLHDGERFSHRNRRR